MRLNFLSSIIAIIGVAALVACTSRVAPGSPHPVDDQVTAIFRLSRTDTGPGDTYDGPRQPGWLDPMNFFTVLTHLAMREDEVLDYVYYAVLDGGPALYVRPRRAAPLPGIEAYRNLQAAWSDTCPPGLGAVSENAWLSHVALDGAPESYVEFALLYVLGEQFYLGWHLNYDDEYPVASRAGLDRALALADTTWNCDVKSVRRGVERLESADFRPTVTHEDGSVVVTLWIFSKWGGLSRDRIGILDGSSAHVVTRVSETMVPYDCGIMF